VAQAGGGRGDRLTQPAILDAAAVWLSRIPESERITAQAATDWRLAAWVSGGVILLGACVIVSRMGLPGRARLALEAERPRPWLTGAAVACLLALILAALKALIDAVTDSRTRQILGVADAGLAGHLAHAASTIAPDVLAAALLAPPLLWLMRRWPRTWPLVAGSLVTALIAAVVWLPYALSLGAPTTLAPPGPVRDGLLRLIGATGIPAHDVLLATDPGVLADVNGSFGQAKVIVGPALAAGPPAEARAIVGHIMGHYVHNDILIFSLVMGLVMLLGFFAVAALAAPLARLVGAKGVASPAEPEALPAVAIILMLAVSGAWLAGAGYLRWANVRADAYSLEFAGAPDGLASVIEQEWDHQSVDPSPLEEALFYSHPGMIGRLRHAMAWKAAHGG
jgi:STE24 endopeptidase